jgi:endonuclease/exonuclease/phosphatase family metal-dependent hydrolase
MPAFPKPKFSYTVNVTKEKNNLIAHRDNKPGRAIPTKKNNKLLLATWNIANLGLQVRETEHYKLIAEIISWFDLVAIQEVNDDLEGLRELQKYLPAYKVIFTDEGGNNERMAYLYDASKVSILEKFGELSVPPSDYKFIRLPGVTSKFDGFDRNPFLATFKVGNLELLLLNVHLYFGDESEKKSIERRCLETFCVSRWADLRRKSKYCYTPNIIALGDFNLPKREDSDPVYKALRAKGLELPDHSTKIYSNISNDADYDQIAFFPGLKSKLTGKSGVFDFDGGIFPDLYSSKTAGEFKGYLRYYISDHRPMWIELDVS